MTPTLSTFKPGDTVRIVVSDWGIPAGTLLPVVAVGHTPTSKRPSLYVWVQDGETWPFYSHEIELAERAPDPAPALLSALREAHNCLIWCRQTYGDDWPANANIHAIIQNAEATIAQATGSGAAS